ncbi:acyl carrier protein [Kitasatospora sp. NPDC093550]|uniref:acyl carrier protein n=1 Tax=Kitasatospora sp. NPDC093550 TaxID=3364089 RepID=UPI00381F6CED
MSTDLSSTPLSSTDLSSTPLSGTPGSGTDGGDTDRSGGPTAPAVPATPDALVAVFRRVLERDDVTVDSDFFDLGGDSLVATRVLSTVARTHGVELTFDDFLLAPTPGRLAQRITAAA